MALPQGLEEARLQKRALKLQRNREKRSNSWLRRDRQRFTIRGTLTALFSGWLTIVLTPAIPTAFAVKYTNQNAVVTFATNFVAIFPLSRIFDVVTEELNTRRGAGQGLLIIVTVRWVENPSTLYRAAELGSSNLVQLIITIIATLRGQFFIVQTSLVGAVISNSVLLVGVGFLLGGLEWQTQYFDPVSTGSFFNQLTFSVIGLIIPTASSIFGRMSASTIAKISRAESLILLLSYLSYLLYCYKSHKEIWVETKKKSGKRWKDIVSEGDTIESIASIGAMHSATMVGVDRQPRYEVPEEQGTYPKMSSTSLVLILVIDTVILGFCTTFAVDSIDGLTQQTVLSQSFVGLILLPILSCNFHAIKLAYEDKMSLSFAITINGSIQLLLGILPLAVIIGWIRKDPAMNLLFNTFQVVSLAISVMVLKIMTQLGSSHW